MPDGKRNTQMDGLRGCAAIAVIVFHSILDRDPTQNVRIVRSTIQEAKGAYDVISKLVFMVVSGETAVVIFFALSGSVLFESLRQRHARPRCNRVWLFREAASSTSMARRHPLEWGLLLAIPVTAAAVMTAHIAERSLERPLMALGRKLTQFSVGPDSLAGPVSALS